MFAAASELLLRRLRRHFPGTLNRAYADDLAMIVRAALRRLGLIATMFQEFAAISGLTVHIGKTVFVPLWRYNEVGVRACIARWAAQWNGIAVAGKAKYLGFALGPAKGEASWESALQTYRDRASQWGRAGLGLWLGRTLHMLLLYSCL